MEKYLNSNLSYKERAKDLVSKMTLDEKISQTLHESPAIERLGIPAHCWWSEALHGVARNGTATVFPQAIGLAAMWDTDMMLKVADIISTEARAKHHEAARNKDFSIYKGLTYWSPNINIFRDPRWGRGQETYGECPYLTSRMGVAFIEGLQGDNPKYLKVAACAKHLAAHSGPEAKRHNFDTKPSKKDFFETYMPAFEAAICEAKTESTMTAYTQLYGEPCSGSSYLLQDIIRDKFGFEGHVVSDCGAVEDFHVNQGVTKCTAESAAKALRAGCDLNCGYAYSNLHKAVDEGLITETEIDQAVERLMVTRLKLGLYASDNPYANIPFEVNDCNEHRKISLEAAQKSITLLKNSNNLLPIDKKKIKSIAVIGPNADDREVLYGNYNGFPSKTVTILEGIQNYAADDCRVWYARGCHRTDGPTYMHDNGGIEEALSIASRSDIVILIVGLDSKIEGEEGDAFNSAAAGDRITLDLTGKQNQLIETISKTGKPVILVSLNGGAIALNYAQDNINSIMYGFYPGQEGGNAVASVIFGEYNPAGRLPYTVVKDLKDLPDFEDYNMEGRTYRYIKDITPLYPFGFGLSYTHFEYSDINISGENTALEQGMDISVKIENTGNCDGEEVAQLYITRLGLDINAPVRQLVGFKRIFIPKGKSNTVNFKLTPKELAYFDENGDRIYKGGDIIISVGGSQGDKRSQELGAKSNITQTIKIS